MSNPERDPVEVTCRRGDDAGDRTPVVLGAREVPLGGPRAMRVRRSLPQRGRTLIGAWCFVDHYGPDDVFGTGGMSVPGHPHTGLQTVSWLFRGEVEHRDSTGVHVLVRPGELNLMTAGAGIAHSEHSTPATRVLHGAQLWVALPESARDTAPGFEHHAPQPLDVDGATVRVLLGELFGDASPVTTHTPLLGAELVVPAGRSLEIPVDPDFEHGFLCDTGTLTSSRVTAKPGEILFHPVGARRLTVAAGADEPARALLLGGTPFGEQIIMWWNFVGRSHDEIVEFRDAWQRERAGAGGPARRFGELPAAWSDTLAAPPLPNARLRSRG